MIPTLEQITPHLEWWAQQSYKAHLLRPYDYQMRHISDDELDEAWAKLSADEQEKWKQAVIETRQDVENGADLIRLSDRDAPEPKRSVAFFLCVWG